MRSRPIPARPFDGPQTLVRRERHELDRNLREALWQRCGGQCEACSGELDRGAQAHHRKRRSQGGDDSVTNLVLLHPLCHRRIHSHPAWAFDTGFLVHATDQPGRIRVALFGERWVRLAVDGSYVAAA